ncbi:MAG: sulfatase-like hydrolase/transferase [Nanoarchaeota archaeon]|nr:sulfatase-like hydrolase/transferase [Nanoarchaeota archaeon]
MLKIEFDNYHFKVIIFSTLFLFIFKFFRTLDYYALVYNSIIEFCVMFILFVLFKLIIKNRGKISRVIITSIYYIIFVVNFFLFMLTNYFFNDTYAIKYSFFSVNVHYFSFFIESVIQPSLVFFILFLILILFILPLIKISSVIALISIKKASKFEKYFFKGTILLYCCVVFLLLFPIFMPEPMNNVYATTIIDISQLPSQSFTIVPANFEDIELKELSRELDEYSNYSINRDRVLIFMMEEVSFSNFIEDSSKLAQEENFFKRVENNSHFFTNYYTQNQDSKGSLWSLFFSRFIPFESYINNWNQEFGYFIEDRNLVHLFNYHKFHTTTVAAQLEASLILGTFNWDENIFLPKFPFEGKVCIRELEYQSGCEDIVLIEDVKNSIRDNKKLFLFQQFIFGHGVSYLVQSGMTRVEYYNMYMNLIYDFLEEENLLENTTIVVMADHGDKGFMSKEIENYNIPLFIIDKSLKYKEIDTMYSHIDFNNILMSYLDESRELPPQRDEVHIIGQTASSELAYINSTGNYFTSKRFIRNIYSYESPIMRGDEVEREIQQILLHQEHSRNVSSQKNFYCVFCYQNELDIISRRE